MDEFRDDIVADEDEKSDESCVVFSFCKACYDNAIMLVASINKMSFEEAKEKSCRDPHELYCFRNFNFKKRYDYCLVNACFAKIVRFIFTSLDDQCV